MRWAAAQYARCTRYSHIIITCFDCGEKLSQDTMQEDMKCVTVGEAWIGLWRTNAWSVTIRGLLHKTVQLGTYANSFISNSSRRCRLMLSIYLGHVGGTVQWRLLLLKVDRAALGAVTPVFHPVDDRQSPPAKHKETGDERV